MSCSICAIVRERPQRNSQRLRLIWWDFRRFGQRKTPLIAISLDVGKQFFDRSESKGLRGGPKDYFR